MEDLYIGKLLDNRYEILEQIGSGGMAVVYKAKCHRLNRMVALKILKPDLAQDAEFRRRFHDESQAVAMLSHPNIVAVYDVSKSSDLEYIVMELIDGITLKQYMHRKGEPLNWREALHFISQIVKALGHAHSRGIIHRDIKPQNMMVLRDGSVKVADFGIARLTSAQQSTLTQEALGSVHYISPEQARGSRIDARSDLYSAGVVLYEMLTGRLPFEGDSPVSVAIQHINSIPLPPRELNPDVPEALEAITMKAMASNMNNRYNNAGEMLADLEEFRKNPNINFDYHLGEPSGEDGGDEPTMAIPIARRQTASGRLPRRPSETSSEEYEDEEELDTARRKRTQSNLGPILMGAGVLLIFFIGIGYFIWVTFLSGLLEPTAQYTIPQLVGRQFVDIQMDSTVTTVFTVEQNGVVFSAEVPAGEVISQSPLAGEKRKQGDELTITVQVSAGLESLVMENVANLEYRKALLQIQNLGLKVDTPEYVPSDTVPKGYVVSYTPRAGATVEAGDIVHLIISTGPENVKTTVSDFTGVSLTEAKRMIVENGLTLGEIKKVPDMSLPDTVLEQSETVGAEVSEGSVVHLTISLGPDEEIPPEFSPSPTPTPSDPPTATPPAVTPSDVPAVGPATPTPAPTPNYKTVPVDLGGGEGTVQVTITVGGKSAYDNVAGRNLGTVTITVPGTGVQEVKIYLDGALVDTRTVDFSN